MKSASSQPFGKKVFRKAGSMKEEAMPGVSVLMKTASGMCNMHTGCFFGECGEMLKEVAKKAAGK